MLSLQPRLMTVADVSLTRRVLLTKVPVSALPPPGYFGMRENGPCPQSVKMTSWRRQPAYGQHERPALFNRFVSGARESTASADFLVDYSHGQFQTSRVGFSNPSFRLRRGGMLWSGPRAPAVYAVNETQSHGRHVCGYRGVDWFATAY